MAKDVTQSPYNAVGDGVTDDTAAFTSAVVGGGLVNVPPGHYRLTGPIFLPADTILQGEGQRISVLIADHTGSCLKSGGFVNSSVVSNVRVERLGIHAGQTGSTGAGFEDNCGTYIYLRDVAIVGFKWGIIFDQTEVSHIDLCNIGSQESGGAAIWLANADTRTSGAAPGFTNCISVTRCQINVPAGVYGIIDEGGVAHSYTCNNYNIVGPSALYLAGVAGCEVSCSEFEGCSSGYTAVLDTYTFYPVLSTGNRAGVGSCAGSGFYANQIGGTSNAGLRCLSVGHLSVIGNSFGGTMPIVDSLSEVAVFTALGNGYGTTEPPEMFKPEYPGTIGPQGPQGEPGDSPNIQRSEGQGTIERGKTSVVVEHNLGAQPAQEDVSHVLWGPQRVWLAGTSPTTLTFRTDRAPASPIEFTWSASIQV